MSQTSLISMKEAVKRSGFSRSTISTLINKNQFPKPIKIGYAIRFIEQEVEDWIQGHIQRSRNDS